EPWTTDDDRTDSDLAAESERLTPSPANDEEERATPATDGGQGGDSP
ncbi:MAG: hypothetical protein ACI8TL_001787, partial [Natronomonas sp.]